MPFNGTDNDCTPPLGLKVTCIAYIYTVIIFCHTEKGLAISYEHTAKISVLYMSWPLWSSTWWKHVGVFRKKQVEDRSIKLHMHACLRWKLQHSYFPKELVHMHIIVNSEAKHRAQHTWPTPLRMSTDEFCVSKKHTLRMRDYRHPDSGHNFNVPCVDASD